MTPSTPPDRVGLLGYGHFGRAFAGLLVERGIAFRYIDPAGQADDPLRLADERALAEWSPLLMLGTPVARMRGSLEALRPHLGPRHVVFDVGSVKTIPIALMQEILGDAVPWTATHPLFGPTSLALGERPLRVVVCPGIGHAAAAARVHALFERLGCQLLPQDPATHDRAMAEMHALPYFVAKGMLEAGVDIDPSVAPPSALGIARTIESARSDAGHLFTTLHRQNPFAGETRRRFLEALHEIDLALRAQASAVPDAGASIAVGTGDAEPTRGRAGETGDLLEIPDLGARSPALRETRDLIDEIDRDLMGMLARRAALSRRAAEAKADLGAAVRDPRREDELRGVRRAWAEAAGLDPAAVEDIFDAILRFSRRHQER